MRWEVSRNHQLGYDAELKPIDKMSEYMPLRQEIGEVLSPAADSEIVGLEAEIIF